MKAMFREYVRNVEELQRRRQALGGRPEEWRRIRALDEEIEEMEETLRTLTRYIG